MAWRTSKRSAKLGRAKQKIQKTKIRWGALGLTPPDSVPSVPIDEIRKQVIILASRGIGQGVRSRSSVESKSDSTPQPRAGTGRRGRQAAAE